MSDIELKPNSAKISPTAADAKSDKKSSIAHQSIQIGQEKPLVLTNTNEPKQGLSIPAKIVLIILSPLLLVLLLLVLLFVGLYTLICFPCLRNDRFGRHPASASSKPSLPSSAVTERAGSFFQSSTAGVWLYTQSWLPRTTPRALVFVAHGFGEHCHRAGYDALAAQLNENGIAMFAVDHQGHGFSTGTRAYAQEFQHFVDDFIGFTHRYDNEYDVNIPRFLFGHSMGGLLAVKVAVDTSETNRKPPTDNPAAAWQYRGAIFSAPATFVDPEIATPLLKFVAKILSFLAPKKALDPLPASFISRNPTAVEAYVNDPLNFVGGIRARLAKEMLATQDYVNTHLKVIEIPVLCLHGGGDKIVMVKSSEDVYANVGTAEGLKHFKIFEGAYHEVMEDEEHKQSYFDAVTAFINKNL